MFLVVGKLEETNGSKHQRIEDRLAGLIAGQVVVLASVEMLLLAVKKKRFFACLRRVRRVQKAGG